MRQLPKECTQFIVFDLLIARAVTIPTSADEFVRKSELQEQRSFKEWFLHKFGKRDSLKSIAPPNKTAKDKKISLFERSYYESRFKERGPFLAGISKLFNVEKYAGSQIMGFCLAALETDENIANHLSLSKEKKDTKISSAYLHNRLVISVKNLVKSEISNLTLAPDSLLDVIEEADAVQNSPMSTVALNEFFGILPDVEMKGLLLDSTKLSRWDFSVTLKKEDMQSLLELSHFLEGKDSRDLVASELMRRITYSESLKEDIRILPDSLKPSIVSILMNSFDEGEVSRALLETLPNEQVIIGELAHRISEGTVKSLSSKQMATLLQNNSRFADETMRSILASIEKRMEETGQELSSILSSLLVIKEKSSSVTRSLLNNVCIAMDRAVKSYGNQVSSLKGGQTISTMQAHIRAQLLEQSWNSARKDLLNSIEADITRWAKMLDSLKEFDSLELAARFISVLREGTK
ncbi:MAG TPA: hypothetical protein ENN47_04885 [Mesotoga infera]|uniref:Uncharacterized protein n=1 Tax=Mesotoga infera TaxID=1236046 RepID=A0A7C1CUR2_9BACT|nr:hypothetical protein [Mesotoga infera]